MIERDSDTGDSSSPSETVIKTVAAKTDTEPTALPPLHNVINPDALDQLFINRSSSGTVTFSYCGHIITISDTGEIIVQEEAESINITD